MVPSAIFSVFYNDEVLHLTIDSGCTGNIIRLNVVERLNIMMKPTKIKAKLADDKTYLEVVGEIDINLTRGKTSFKFEAIVVTQLGPDILAGTPFMKANDVMTDFVNELVIVQKKYRYPFTSQQTTNGVADSFVVRIQKSEIILPGESLSLKIPRSQPTSQTYIVENRQCLFLKDPIEIDTAGYNMKIPNLSSDPIQVKKNSHLQIRRVRNVVEDDIVECDYPRKPTMLIECNLDDILIDPSNKLFNDKQRSDIKKVLNDVKIVFNGDDSTYKGNYKASFEFSSHTRPILKNSKLPSYSSKHNNLLQQKCDKLWSRGKIVPISSLGVQPNCLNQPFLVKKQKAINKKLDECTEQDTRMVTSFGPLAKLVKKNVSKVTTEKEVWSKLAQWKYIAESDLTDSFHQLVLKRADTTLPLSDTNVDCPSYMCFKTPYKGIFAYVTGAQGMPGMSEHLDNVLDETIGDLVQTNKAFKIHDQIYVGGQDFESFLSNIKEVFYRLGQAGLRLGADKTIIGVYSSVIYGKLWQNGTLTPSQHKITNLAKVPIPETVGKLRSFIQGAKINSECLEGLAQALAPFGKLVGCDKNKQDKVTWTPILQESFYKAQEILRNPASITIPKPSDQLMIIVDSATKPEKIDSITGKTVAESASSATLIVKRKGEKTSRIGGYFSFQLKSGMLPCEAEGKGLERAVQHWDHYIRENENPTLCLVDNISVVQCARKLCNGEYSESPKLQTFLYLLNSKNINIQHNSAKISNKFIENVDWGSRNFVECKPDPDLPDIHENCPYCQLAWKNEDVSFAPVRFADVEKHNNEIEVSDITVEELLRKPSLTPYKSRATWINLQKSCQDMRKAVAHLKAGTVPSPKEKNLRMARYYIQHCRLASDGLLIHEKHVPLEVKPRLLIVVPQSYLKALLLQLHVYCDTHTTEMQTESLFNRMFWAIHTKQSIKDVISSCQTCLSTKLFPRSMLEFNTETKPDCISSHFAADVLVKNGKFLILREVLTSHTSTIQIKDEKADTLRSALMALLAHYKTLRRAQIRTDNQTGLKALVNDKILNKINVEIIPGDVKNINKNPVAERAIREIEDEILKIQTEDKQITQAVLAQATMAVNNKIRYTGYTANELYTNTNNFTGQKLNVQDRELSNLQFSNRQKSHESSAKSKSTVRGSKLINPIVDKGDLIMIKSDKSKHEARKVYLVVEVDSENKVVIVQKFVNNQVRNKKYKVKIEQIILVEKCNSNMSEDSNLGILNEDFNNIERPIHDTFFEIEQNNEDNCDESNIETIISGEQSRSTRSKPRLDYSKLNSSGNKIVKAQKVKIDWNSECLYCLERHHSNFYHSEEKCVRKQLEMNKDESEEENEFILLPLTKEHLTDSKSCNDLTTLDMSQNINCEHKKPKMSEKTAILVLQAWWRKILVNKMKESWDETSDPPNWGQSSLHPVSLQVDSDDGVESLFNDIEIEREKYISQNIQDIIDELQSNTNDQDLLTGNRNESSDSDDLFEYVSNSKRRTSSVTINVYGDKSCRSNSEEFFVPKHIAKLNSVNDSEHRMLTRSRSKMQRVPLNSTPLKEHIREQSRPPDSPQDQQNDA